MTVRECGRLLRSKQVCCAELLEQTLAGLESGERFHSFITPTWESARAQAKTLDKELANGLDRGPFHGVPIAHKDNYYTKGVRTTAGSLIFKEFVPDYDATVVERFREAGAVCVGKTNMHELAFGITSKNPHYGAVLNPRDTNRIAGGSSGGSAALVASGLLPFATGSDTGGSIRVPASYCGIAGLKPTYGRVSRRGLLPLSFSLDCAGPLANTVEDCALAMNVMAGKNNFLLDSVETLQDIRIGFPPTFFERLDTRIAQRVQEAIDQIEAMGGVLTEVQTPDLETLNTVARIVQMGETGAIYSMYGDATQFGADVWSLLQQSKAFAAHEYVNAQRLRTLFRKQFALLWQQIDFLVTPTTPITAPLLIEDSVLIGTEQMDVRLASTSLVRSWNLTGEPAVSLPCPPKSGELPVGLQLIGPPFSEARLLQLARCLELHFA